MSRPSQGRRGRPLGMKLSQKSKDQIAKSKTGQKHSEETKKKISEGVKKYHETGAPIDILMSIDFNNCGKFKSQSGYTCMCIPNPVVGEPSYQQRYHVALVERELGRKLKRGEEIHHWGEKDNNDMSLITLCNSRGEHKLLDKAKSIVNRPII